MKTPFCAFVLALAGTSQICLGAAGVGGLLADLRSPLPAVRLQAAVRLAQIADPSAVPALVEAMGDPASEVRREAAKALGAIKDARAAAALAAALGDGDANVRFYAAYALGEIRDPAAAGALLRALGDPQWCVRDQAAWALREIGDPALAEPLSALLQREDADVPHLVWLLGELRAPQLVDALAGLLRLGKAESRMLAVEVLADLDDDRKVAPLLAALEDASPAVRRRAIEVLLKIRDDRAKEPLKRASEADRDPAVRAAAKEAFVELSREKDLAAHWSFDDGGTSVARDVTGGGNDGQIVGCTPMPGKIGKALLFGPGKYVELGKAPGLPIGNKPVTIMAWAKADAPNGVVVARGGAFCGYSLYVKDGAPRFGIRRSQEGPTYIAAGRQPVVGTWVHLAGVIKQDRIELYVDGRLVATEKTDGYIPGNCGQGMEIGFDTGNSPAEITDPFQGVIDEVKQYQAALPEEEIGKKMASEP